MVRDEAAYQEKVDQYMHGYCMFFAASLYHRYGFPIALMTVLIGHERLSHAWVVTPHGCFDIQGIQTLKEMTAFQDDAPDTRYKLYNPTTLDHLEQLAGTKLPADDPDVMLALAAAETFLEPDLQKWR